VLIFGIQQYTDKDRNTEMNKPLHETDHAGLPVRIISLDPSLRADPRKKPASSPKPRAKRNRPNITRKSCELKKTYPDHKAAVKALHRSARAADIERELTGSTKRRECRSYSCPGCRKFHLTSIPTTYRQVA
jgi:hypothetical protein